MERRAVIAESRLSARSRSASTRHANMNSMTSKLRRRRRAGAAFAGTGAQASPRWTIVGADVADGTGSALRRVNVRVVNDRIVSVGSGAPQSGDTVVAGAGLVVAPGFIDIHNHSADELANDPAAATQVAQGITTAVVGPDGGSPWPIGEYLTERRRSPAALNVAAFAGHATIRRVVMGDDFKRPARRRRGRADGDARRSGDARRRRGAVERSRVRSRRLRRDERARRALESRGAVRRRLHVAHPRRSGQELRGVSRGDRDRRARRHRRADLAHQARHGRRVAQGRGGDRADRGGEKARRRRHRGRVSVQRLELHDHRARPRQALRLPAERREGARRRRRGGERADRQARGAPGVRVQDARRRRERAQR